MRIKLSQSDWQKIGIKMGWIKSAQSNHWYKHWSIMGYTWMADEHSVNDTKRAIKAGILKVTDPNARLDEHGIPEEGVEDREGNEIHPIFAGDQEDVGEIDDEDAEGGDDDQGPTTIVCSLITNEGNLVVKGKLEISDLKEMHSALEGAVKNRACGPDGPYTG